MDQAPVTNTLHFSHGPKNYACPYCRFLEFREKGIEDTSALLRLDDVVLEARHCIAFMAVKWWPRNPGHVLIVPKHHIENIYSMPDEILSEIGLLSKRIAIAQKIAFRCDGTSTRQHNEPAGYQHVWHFHQHVVPRWKDDNFYHLAGKMVPPSARVPYAELLRAELNRPN